MLEQHQAAPQMRYGRFRREFRAPACPQCSFSASLCRLPCLSRWISTTLTLRGRKNALGDLARLHNPLQLFHDQRADPHYKTTKPPSVPVKHTRALQALLQRTFFPNQTIVPVVRVVRIPQPSVRVLKLEELVAVLARVACTVAHKVSTKPQTNNARGIVKTY